MLTLLLLSSCVNSPLPPAHTQIPPPPLSEEELPELETLVRAGAAPFKAQGGVESKQGKANVLIQVCVVY